MKYNVDNISLSLTKQEAMCLRSLLTEEYNELAFKSREDMSLEQQTKLDTITALYDIFDKVKWS